MSEITISTGHPDAGRIYAEALDQVTAERDAGLAREAALAQNLKYAEQGYLSIAESADASAQTLHEVITRLKAERDAERRRADVAVADANAADAAGKKVSELLSNRTAERDAALGREAALQKCISTLELIINSGANRCGALQARLTAADEREDVLVTALSKIKLRLDAFVEAERDMPSPSVEVCQSIAYAALKPAEGQLNQCDGCQAGIPVVNGAHRMGNPGAYPDTMSCTAKLYKP